MAIKVNKAEMWSTTIDDRAGGAAARIGPLAQAGANFEFVFARRTPENPGRGLVFVAPVKGKKVIAAAQAGGFAPAANIYSLRLEGADKAGMGSKILGALAGAGISFRGMSAMAIGKKFVTYLALDSAEDAAKAAGVLRKVG